MSYLWGPVSGADAYKLLDLNSDLLICVLLVGAPERGPLIMPMLSVLVSDLFICTEFPVLWIGDTSFIKI